jgi:hypothetical protein
VSTRFERTVAQLFDEFFPELGKLPVGGNIVAFAFAVLQGAAISGYAGFGNPDDAVSVLRSLTVLATPELLPLLEGITDDHRAGS